MNIDNSTFFNNHATSASADVVDAGGGMIMNSNGTLTITNSRAIRNTAVDDGGAIVNFSPGIIAITDSIFVKNTAGVDASVVDEDINMQSGDLTLVNTFVDVLQ